MDGLEVQQCLRERGIALPIILITAYGDIPTCVKAFKMGAFDFLEKPLDDAILLDSVRKALVRDSEQKLQDEFAHHMTLLTPVEKEVFDQIISGMDLKAIATDRKVSVQTVWRHRLAVFAKMGVKDDVALVRLATQLRYEPRQ